MAIGGSGGGNIFAQQNNVQANIQVITNVNQSIQQFNRLQSQVNNFATQTTRNMQRTQQSFEGVSLGLRRIHTFAIAAGLGFYELTRKAMDFVKMGGDMEQLRLRITAMSLSTQSAAESMDRLLTLARKSPFSLEAISRSFIKLKASGIDPIIDDQGNGPLKDLMDAIAAMGGAMDETLDRATIAISQMAGKGVVSMEELRQQLGEAIPTALRILALESGKSIRQVVKEVSDGQFTFERFRDTFFTGLRKLYGGAGEVLTKTFLGALGQTRTELQNLADVVFNQTGTLRYFTGAIMTVNEQLRRLGDYLKTAAGQKYIDDLWEGFKDLTLQVTRALSPVRDIVELVMTLAKSAASVVDPDVATAGIIGYILFGKKGAVALALIESTGDMLSNIIGQISAFATGGQAIVSSLGGVTSAGILGYLIAGQAGVIVAMVGTIIDKVKNEYEELIRGSLVILYTLGKAASNPMGFYNDWGKNLDEAVMNTNTATQELTRIWEDFTNNAAEGGKEDFNSLEATTTQVFDTIEDAAKSAQNAIDLIGKSKATGRPLSELQEEANRVKQSMEEVGNSFVDAGQKMTTVTKGVVDNVDLRAPITALNELAQAYADAGNLEFAEYIMQQSETLTSATQNAQSYGDVLASLKERQMDIGAAMEDMPGGDLALFSGEDVERLKGQIDQWVSAYEKLEQSTAETAQSVTTNVESMSANIVPAINDFLDQLDQTTGSLSTYAGSTDQLASELDNLKVKYNEVTEAVKQSSLTEEEKAQVLANLANHYQMMEDAAAGAADRVKTLETGTAASAKEMAAVSNAVSELNQRAQNLMLGSGLDEEAQRISQASGEIRNLLGDIDVEIERIREKQADGLITDEAANASIANLNQIRAALESNRETILYNVSEMGQAYKSMVSSIYSSFESAFGDMIYGLVTGTKSAKEVLLDFYNAITRAVADYLAKQIMVGMFGGQGGFGNILGSIFTPFGAGGLLGFASGGSFVVDGRGGRDQNMVPLALSKGERVDITPAGEEFRGGRGGAEIHIHAFDGPSVEATFLRHGQAIIRSINARTRLNRMEAM